MAFVNAETGKQIKLEKGYLSKPVDYQTFLKQQEAKRQSAVSVPAAAAAQETKAKGNASGINRAEGLPSAALSKGAASPAAARNRVEGLPSARPSVVSLENQKRQAQVDQDTDAILRLNKQLKEERARNPSRMYDLMVGAAKTYGSGFAGFGALAAETAAAADKRASQSNQRARQERENIRRYQTMLSRGTMDDGTPIDAALRRQLEGYIKSSQRFVDADAAYQEQVHAPLSAASEAAYRKAEDLSKSGQKNIERAKRGLGAAGRFAVDMGVAGVQMAGDAALGAVTGGSALVPMFLRSAGGAASEGKEAGTDYGDRALYALGSGALGVATEKISNVAGPFKKIFGSGAAEKIAGKLVTRFGENQAVQIMSRLSQTAAGKTLLSAIGEGTEELTESILDVPLRRMTIDRGAAFDPVEAGYEFLVGAALGGAGGAVEGVQNRMRRKTAQGGVQEAQGARFEAGKGMDATPAQRAAQAAQIGPENIFIKTAADAKAEGDRKVRGTLELMQRAAGMETGAGQQETAPGTGAADVSLVERIQKSVPQLQGMEPVANVKGNELPSGGKLIDRLARFTASFGNKVLRPGFGEVFFSRGKLKSSMIGHGMGGAKIETFPAVPAIIQRGQQIDFQPNWKGRNYDTYTFAAPVNYKGSPTYIGVIVAKDKQSSRYYLHEVVDEHGNVIFQNTEAPAAVQDGTSALSGDLDTVPAVGAEQMSPSDGRASQMGAVDTVETSGAEGTSAPSADSTIPQGADSVKPAGTDGLGAADAGSLNSDYDRLQAQSSRFHPEGPNAARPVDVPTQDFEGRNVSKAASTVMGAQILDDADVANLEQMVADGAFSFDTIRDKDAVQKAQDTVQAIGFDRALERYIQAARSNTATKDNMVLGQILMSEAARGGNRKALAEICSLYARNSTNIAQAMQAQRILRQLGPEARLYALQNSVNELSEKYGVDIELDQTALNDFMNAENEEARQTAEAALVQSAASQLPTTFRAKYDAVRYLAMLGNPRTYIRNIAGNLAFQVPATVKNRVGALAERGAQALGADVERTKSLIGANPFGALAREARADWANAKPFLEGSKYSEGKVTAGAIEQEAKPFQNSGALGKAVGWAADKNGALLEAEDTLFKKWIYSQSLAGYLHANGVKSISEADPALLNRARNYAAQEALRNTFNDRNDFSDFVAKLGNLRNSKNKTARAASYLTEGLLPFKRTPANVAARAVEYSPVGAAASVMDLLNKGAHGQATAETVAKGLDRLAAGLSGTALLGLGFLASGMVTGGEDEDKDQQNFNDLTGHQTYALETPGGTSITLDWLAPSAIPFFMGVELAHAMQDGGVSWEDAVNTLKNMSEPMLEMSMLQGLNDVFENAAYAQQHGGSVMGAAVVSAATNYLTQVFPTLFGQLERAAEGTRMTTYADKNDRFSKDLQFFLGKTSQKVPGWDYHQIPYLDAWGREEDNGDPVKRVFNNLINPAYVSQVKVDAVEKELQRVADTTGNTGVFPSRAKQSFTFSKTDAKGKPVKDANGNTIPVTKNLSAGEYQTYAKRRGQASVEVLQSMLNSPVYQNLSDEKKAEAIAYAYQYAESIGKMAVSDYRPGDGTIARGTIKTGLPAAGYILLQLNKDRDGDGKVTNLEETQTLQELPDLSGEQRGKAWEAMNQRTKQAKNPFTGVLSEQGMTPEEAASAWKIYDGKGTEDDPYTKSEKIKDLQEELDLPYMDAAQIYRLMKKAAEKK